MKTNCLGKYEKKEEFFLTDFEKLQGKEITRTSN